MSQLLSLVIDSIYTTIVQRQILLKITKQTKRTGPRIDFEWKSEMEMEKLLRRFILIVLCLSCVPLNFDIIGKAALDVWVGLSTARGEMKSANFSVYRTPSVHIESICNIWAVFPKSMLFVECSKNTVYQYGIWSWAFLKLKSTSNTGAGWQINLSNVQMYNVLCKSSFIPKLEKWF